jgi:hypothetical protein
LERSAAGSGDQHRSFLSLGRESTMVLVEIVGMPQQETAELRAIREVATFVVLPEGPHNRAVILSADCVT